jgi:hypothetical protein
VWYSASGRRPAPLELSGGSFLQSHFLKQKIRHDLPKPLILERKLLQHTAHFVPRRHVGRDLAIACAIMRNDRLTLGQRQFPPTMKGHDAHTKRLANVYLGFTSPGKFVCSVELR